VIYKVFNCLCLKKENTHISKCVTVNAYIYIVLYMCLLMTYLIYVVAAAETIEDE